MKILIAGASGAIGRPILQLLRPYSYEIYGIAHSEVRGAQISELGAKPLMLDVLDENAVLKAVQAIQPEVMIDMLTHLPKHYTPKEMQEAAETDVQVRLGGGANLVKAGLQSGIKRYIAQSCAFWYAPGDCLADETTPFAMEASPGIKTGARMYKEIEERILQAPRLEAVALRFGFFYGPGTWFHPEGDVADQVRKQQFPIIGKGLGVWSFVHIEDAAQAIVSSLTAQPGIYNIVNDSPSKMCDWLAAFARYCRAKAPPFITEEEGLKQRGADAVYYAMHLRGASNTKAKEMLHFTPRPFEWLS